MASVDQLKQLLEKLQPIVNELDQLTSNPANFVAAAPNQTAAKNASPPMDEFNEALKQFNDSAANPALQDAELKLITATVNRLFFLMTEFVEFSFKAKRPSKDVYKQIATTFQTELKPLIDMNRSSKVNFNHAQTFSEGLQAVFWVFVEEGSAKGSIDGALESADYWSLKIRKLEIKEQIDWYVNFSVTLKKLGVYVGSNFPTGLTWNNSKGISDYAEIFQLFSGKRSQIARQGGQAVTASPVQSEIKEQIQNNATSNSLGYPSLEEYENNINDFVNSSSAFTDENLKKFTSATAVILRKTLIIVSASVTLQKPDDAVKKNLNGALSEIIKKLYDYQKHREINDFVKAITEGISAAFWVLSDTPQALVDGAIESSEYFGLQVRNLKNQDYTNWYNNYHKTLQSLAKYTISNFPTGLTWNTQTGTNSFDSLIENVQNTESNTSTPTNVVTTPEQAAPANPPPPSSLPPPPPPPPPPPLSLLMQAMNSEDYKLKEAPPGTAEGANDRAALFAQINDLQTKGLKHLKKTNKAAPVEEVKKEAPKQEAVKSMQAVAPIKPPLKYFKDNWFIENYVGDQKLSIQEHQAIQKHSLFVDNCQNCAVMVHPQIGTIFLNKCDRVEIAFNTLVSNVQIVNCQNITVTCLQYCPSIQIDKTDGVRITLYGENRNTEIVSAKSSQINISYPISSDELSKESPVPEQFLTQWDPLTNKFVTSTLETFL